MNSDSVHLTVPINGPESLSEKQGMSTKTLTPWFPPEVNPSRDGVYEVCPVNRPHVVFHSVWKRGDWRGATAFGPETAVKYAKKYRQATDAPFYWRGLAKEPK